MKNLFIYFSLLFFSCKNKDVTYNTFIEIEIDNSFPISDISLQKFNPTYDNFDSINYQYFKAGKTISFKLSIQTPQFVHLIDENRIGVGDLFLHSNDSIKLRISLDNGNVKKQILKSKYPGDNMLYQNIYDSVVAMDNTIKKMAFQKNTVTKVYTTIEQLFNKIIFPAIKKNDTLITSSIFTQNVFNYQLANLKTYFNRCIATKYGIKNTTQFTYDTIYKNPKYLFWSRNYYSMDIFRTFIYETINNKNTNSINNFIDNTLNYFANNNDTILNRIAVSSSLQSYLTKAAYEPNFSLKFKIDSICNKYLLDTKYFPLPDFDLTLTNIIPTEVLSDLKIMPSIDLNQQLFSKILTDTSKIYYIDFWASWCGPCVKALPHTNELASKNIPNLKVVYISLDTEVNKFLISEKENKIPIQNSFLIANTVYNNQLLDKLKKSVTIPAYKIIVFKNGNWFAVNALDANDPNLLAQINHFKKK